MDGWVVIDIQSGLTLTPSLPFRHLFQDPISIYSPYLKLLGSQLPTLEF
jgi:hypothetical protein